MSRRALLLVLLGMALLAAGAGMVFRPAGVITAGLLLLAAGYVVAYMEARGR